MKELEIEQEIQARVEFKMNEFLTALKNRINFKYRQTFDMTQKSQYAWQSFEEISEMMKKEINLPTPCDEMAKRRKWELKEKAVEKIVKSLDLYGRNYDSKINTIVSAVETAQNW